MSFERALEPKNPDIVDKQSSLMVQCVMTHLPHLMGVLSCMIMFSIASQMSLRVLFSINDLDIFFSDAFKFLME